MATATQIDERSILRRWFNAMYALQSFDGRFDSPHLSCAESTQMMDVRGYIESAGTGRSDTDLCAYVLTPAGIRAARATAT